jgi:hypothetical protein
MPQAEGLKQQENQLSVLVTHIIFMRSTGARIGSGEMQLIVAERPDVAPP